jgi:hypothetical protein
VTEIEEWRPIPGLDGYEASSAGRIRSRSRVVTRSNGSPLPIPGRVLRPSGRKSGLGYLVLSPTVDGEQRTYSVHVLIARTFIGPRPEGLVLRHRNGDRRDNRASNLCYGTQSENIHDSVTHGTHRRAGQDCCMRGHELSGPNLRFKPHRNSRDCIACSRALAQRAKLRRKGITEFDFQKEADLHYQRILAGTRLYRSAG